MKITIGGVDRDIPPLTFRKLKLVWPLIEANGEEKALDGMARMELGVRLFAIVLMPADADYSQAGIDKAAEEFEGRLLASEVQALPGALNDLLADNGFLKKGGAPGEAAPPAVAAEPVANLSTATSTV
ncbi:MAG TPA: hypothetical protein VHX64_12475 [Caulobacteraceae bacterium]|nr:hypothetical protein [Caulobacteraceae bacterium]